MLNFIRAMSAGTVQKQGMNVSYRVSAGWPGHQNRIAGSECGRDGLGSPGASVTQKNGAGNNT
ncbi:MAG: hypothetical protein AAF526_01490 [Pseudomonadota bacterium]